VTRSLLFAFVLGLVSASRAFAVEQAANPRPLLVTVDDLPLTGAAPESAAERRKLTEAHLAALKAHGIHAVGLVTWGNVHGSEDIELLRLWLEAGQELGNHADRHLDYTQTDLETYRADVEGARKRLQELLEPLGRSVRFFRFPMLHEGDTAEKLDAMRRYLVESGQRNLTVTIDDDDWSFDRPASGLTLLVLRRDGANWRIVQDASF
jgi:peptidoglycan-N-acetylglucosamine deacetylase